MLLRKPDSIRVLAENNVIADPSFAWIEEKNDSLLLKVKAEDTPLCYVRLRWNFKESEKRAEAVKVMGDAWERGYGDLEWRGIVPERCMPWVCMVSNGSDSDKDTKGRFTECFGVKVRAGALCFWMYDAAGVTLVADIRNGGMGVLLGGRELTACEIRFGEYCDMTAFKAGMAYYKTLCDDPLVADHKVYGSNNWYYAYGNSSHEEIIQDTKIVAASCKGLKNPPYMVIDDGWQKYNMDAPWEGGAKFPDMKGLADTIKSMGVRPGIWVRYTNDTHGEAGLPAECHLMRDTQYLDPSHPLVLEYVRETTKKIVGWGYELIKHDYTTWDVFGFWGFERPVTLTNNGWHFYDRTKTSAEIMVALYRTIHEAAGDTVIIGCNVMGHLTAGLAHCNRTGDDTSGREWERTRKMGVNTLAFHMLHNRNFFCADADCVGITKNVPWELNRKWMKALAVSGSPLFISCTPGVLDEAGEKEMREAFARNSVQEDVLEPIDWMETTCPAKWLLNGEEITFDWNPADGNELAMGLL